MRNSNNSNIREKNRKIVWFVVNFLKWNDWAQWKEKRGRGKGERDWENVVRNLKTVCFFHHFERRLSHLINLRTFRERAKQKYFLNYFQFNRSANFLRRTQRQIIISRQRNAPTHNPHFEIILNTICEWKTEIQRQQQIITNISVHNHSQQQKYWPFNENHCSGLKLQLLLYRSLHNAHDKCVVYVCFVVLCTCVLNPIPILIW